MSDDEKPSKTRRKKDMHALQALGEALVDLSVDQLQVMALPEALYDAVREAQGLSRHEARRRQMQYIGKLMREVDPQPIRARLDEYAGTSARAAAALHRAERWRERLLDDEAALTEFAQTHPSADMQALHTTLREARKERLARRPPRHYRELFRLIRRIDAIDEIDEIGGGANAADPAP